MRAAVALALVAASGCAPALLWYGHDPARLTRWELRSREGQTWLEERPAGAAPARRSAAFDEIAVAAMVFDPGGHRFAVPARRGTRWTMLVDLQEGRAWDGVAAPRFSPDGKQLVYAAEQAGRWHVVRDGRPGVAVNAVLERALAFSPSGGRLGYAAISGGCVRVFADQAPPRGCYQDVRALFVGEHPDQDIFVIRERGVAAVVRGGDAAVVEGLATVAFDARAGRWAAVARGPGGARVVVEAETAAEADEIAGLAFSPAGQLAYAERQGSAWHFVIDGQREGPHAWIREATFSSSGRRHGYVAGLPDGRATVVIDGAGHGAWSSADGLVFSADGRRTAYAVRSGAQSGIACDDQVFPFDVVVETSIGFSADGRHWGAVVGDSSRRRLSIVVDGRTHLPFDSEELFGAAAEHAANAGALRGWVTAELERHLREGGPGR